MQSNIIDAFQIMLLGMSVVVLFLIILIFVMKVIGIIIYQIDSINSNDLDDSNNNIKRSKKDINEEEKKIALAIALAREHINKK